MGVIYLVSVDKAAGKTALCAGLAKNLLAGGKSVGYLKPQQPDASGDEDLAFMKGITSATEKSAETTHHGKDVVLVEAFIGTTPDDVLSQRTYGAAREMQAQVICVEPFSSQESRYIESYKGFGGNLKGVILNKMPERLPAELKERREAAFEKEGITLLGCIPENRTMMAVTVAELAKTLDGTLLDNAGTAALVEQFMLGALVVDSGLDYFNRMSEKAVIVRLDRPDMQLAALETPTACLVLAGDGMNPMYNVIEKARRLQVPVITTKLGVGDVAAAIDDILIHSRVMQEKKIACISGMMRQQLDIQALVAG